MTLMQTITDAGIGELLALCGGVCSCATCHVYVESDLPMLPATSADEDGLLDGAEQRKPNSRLSCQIRMSDDYDGMRVVIAPED
jgi:2Fe-2S ferredoxin